MIPYNLQTAVQAFLEAKPGAVLKEYIQGQFGNLVGVVSWNERIYHIYYIRQWFHAFGTIMRIGKCEGVTITTHALERGVTENAIILFFHPDGLYEIEATVFQNFVKNNGTVYRNPRTGIHESGVAFDMLELTNL